MGLEFTLLSYYFIAPAPLFYPIVLVTYFDIKS